MSDVKQFDNVNRNRYYGLRIGDIVELKYFNNFKENPDPKAEVIEYGFMDNNKVKVKLIDIDFEINWVAEWCNIITKVEDK